MPVGKYAGVIGAIRCGTKRMKAELRAYLKLIEAFSD